MMQELIPAALVRAAALRPFVLAFSAVLFLGLSSPAAQARHPANLDLDAPPVCEARQRLCPAGTYSRPVGRAVHSAYGRPVARALGRTAHYGRPECIPDSTPEPNICNPVKVYEHGVNAKPRANALQRALANLRAKLGLFRLSPYGIATSAAAALVTWKVGDMLLKAERPVAPGQEWPATHARLVGESITGVGQSADQYTTDRSGWFFRYWGFPGNRPSHLVVSPSGQPFNSSGSCNWPYPFPDGAIQYVHPNPDQELASSCSNVDGTWVRFALAFVYKPFDFAGSEPYTGQSYDVEAERVAYPGDDAVAEQLLHALAEGDPDAEEIAAIVEHLDQGEGGRQPDPGYPIAAVPSCSGLTYDPCAATLRDAGFTGTLTREFEDFDGADLTKPAGAVLVLDPPPGSVVDLETSFVVTTNPLEPDMPRRVPTVGAAETATAYAERVALAGLVPALSYHPEATSIRTEDQIDTVSPGQNTRQLPGTEVDITAWNRPPRDDERNRHCEIAPGQTGEWNLGSADAWTPFLGEMPSVAPRTPGPLFFAATEPGGTVVLRWGLVNNPATFRGWGWRHIHAKHGYTNADALATQQTLSAGLWFPGDAPGRVNYRAPVSETYTGLSGTKCRRLVAVQRTPWETGQPAAGIITSYGEAQGE